MYDNDWIEFNRIINEPCLLMFAFFNRKQLLFTVLKGFFNSVLLCHLIPPSSVTWPNLGVAQ